MKQILIILLLLKPIILLAQDDTYFNIKDNYNYIDLKKTTDKTFVNNFDIYNSIERKAIVQYNVNSNGYYLLSKNKLVDNVESIEIYAYDNKTKKLYVYNYYGNYEITIDKATAKIYKKNKTIPKVSGKELQEKIKDKNIILCQRFHELNKTIKEKEIQKLEQQKKEEQERERLKKIYNTKKEQYRKSHKWNIIPTKNISFFCSICNKSIKEDSLHIMSLNPDSIYFATINDFYLGHKIIEWHSAKIPEELKENENYKLHCDAFIDSLQNYTDTIGQGAINYVNCTNIIDAYNIIRKEAPYGFINMWSWNNKYDNISFSFNYVNTNKKTIKYIDIYWKVENDVGDIRKRGMFSGTGPLKQYEEANWEWDNSIYYVSGDATNMSITKIVIKYMDGTQKILTGNNIVIN